MARLNYYECARLWVTQQQVTGHTPANRMYFDGPTIYSYGFHFPIACITDKRVDGQRVVLFCWTRRSQTTGKHQSEVWNAIRRHGGFKTFNIDSPVAHSISDHKGNLRELERRYHSMLLRASRTRLTHREQELKRAEEARLEANEYARIFGVGRWWIRPGNPKKLRAIELAKSPSQQKILFSVY